MRNTRHPRKTPWSLIICLGLLLPLAPARAQESPADQVFVGEERITAVDVVVELDPGTLRKKSNMPDLPDGLEAEDFEVFYDGEPRPVVALSTDDPWTVVVWFDAALTGSIGVGQAADQLAKNVDELLRLGPVEIVVTDPLPRTELASTSDRGLVHGALSRLALEPQGRAEIVNLRAEFVAEAQQNFPSTDPEELARFVVRDETRIVRDWQDRLLAHLLEVEAPSARRVLILATSGYDLDPARFYLPIVGLVTEIRGSVDLAPATVELTRTLAAYGWIVMPLVPPPPAPDVRRGPRLGQWRFNPLGANREGDRDPEKAEAYLELGMALHRQGKLDDALDAFEKALRHFYGDPRTADRQALALLEMGEIRKQQGEDERSKRAFAEARQLDAEAAEKRLGPAPELQAPGGALATLAAGTAGYVAEDDKTLKRALASLRRRVRLTYQVAGAPTGELHPVEIRFSKGAFTPRAPAWARSASPATVAAARIRQLLSGELAKGDFDVRTAALELRNDGASRSGMVTAALAPSSTVAAGEEMALRVTIASGGPDVLATVRHESPELVLTEKLRTWTLRRELELHQDDVWVGVLVEDLLSGAWGAAMAPLE